MPKYYRRIILFAIPVTLSNISEPILGVIDTAVLGHLPSPASLSGVAIGAELFMFFISLCNFLRMGCTSITSQLYGQEQTVEIKNTLIQTLCIAVTVGVFLIIFAEPSLKIAKYLYAPQSDVFEEMQTFYLIRVFSAPATLINIGVFGWMLGLQKIKSQLIVIFIINLLNLGLDLFFVINLKWGAKGVAIGSLIATWLGLILNIYIVNKELQKLPGKLQIKHSIYWVKIKKLLRVNSQIFIRTLYLMLCFNIITAWGTRIGTNFLAANVILLNLLLVIAFFLDGIANSLEAQIGKAKGQKCLVDIMGLLKASGICSLILILSFACVFAWLGKSFISLFTSIEPVKSIAKDYIGWVIVFPLITGVSYWLDGVFIGLGATNLMQKVMVNSFLFVFLPALLILQNHGNHGLWLTLTLFMLARSIGMVYYLNVYLSFIFKNTRIRV